jgi:hypothetical protein
MIGAPLPPYASELNIALTQMHIPVNVDVYIVLATTVLGSPQKGLAVTSDGIYYKLGENEIGVMRWENLSPHAVSHNNAGELFVGDFAFSLYDENLVKEMFALLFEILCQISERVYLKEKPVLSKKQYIITQEILNQIYIECQNFQVAHPSKSYFSGVELMPKFNISRQVQLFLGYDSSIMKNGNLGFAITNNGIYCRRSKEMYYFSYSDFANLAHIVVDSFLIKSGTVILAEASFSDGSKFATDLFNLYRKIQNIIKSAN